MTIIVVTTSTDNLTL